MANTQRALTKARGHATRAKRIAVWQDRFLRSLRATPNVKVACKAARVSRQTAYRTRADDPAFSAEWQSALDVAVDELEAVAFKRAMDGDSSLITFLLRCHKPEVYRETQRHEVMGGIIFLPLKEAGAE
jgi:hypothetical protein